MTRLSAMIVVLLAGLCAYPTWAGGSSFTFLCRSDTLQQVAPGATAEFYFTLTNTGSEDDVYRFDCRVLDSVPGWFVVCCVRGLCFEPGTPLYDTLAAGESDTTPHITIYTNATHGEERVGLRVTSMNEPQHTDSIAVRTRVGSGVAEDRTGSAGRVDHHGPLFDVLGRRVVVLRLNERRLGAGVYFVRPAGTKLVLR